MTQAATTAGRDKYCLQRDHKYQGGAYGCCKRCGREKPVSGEGPRLQGQTYAEVIKQRDDLLAAFKDTLAFVDGYADSADLDDPVHEMLKRWEDLIAKSQPTGGV